MNLVKMKTNKKAISPLIATVLLVAFVIILAILVWFWYAEIIEDWTEKSGITGDQQCAMDVDFVINSATPNPGNTAILFEIENKGAIHINNFRIILKGSTGLTATNETNLGVLMATTSQLSMNYDSINLGNVETIDIIPIISVQGQVFTCNQKQQTSNII
jgi:flagellin-like protein